LELAAQTRAPQVTHPPTGASEDRPDTASHKAGRKEAITTVIRQSLGLRPGFPNSMKHSLAGLARCIVLALFHMLEYQPL
jgi:hypothetical protein